MAGAIKTGPYHPTVVPVDWELSELRPKVAIAQLRARYQVLEAGDHRVRIDVDSSYSGRLLESLEQALAQGSEFVLFPEYSWPMSLAEQVLALGFEIMRTGTAWILPFEHLNVGDFRSLITLMPISEGVRAQVLGDVELAAAQVHPTAAYVNVCVTLLKTSSGMVAVPQTKTRGAALEERDLVGSKHIYVIEGRNCRFATFICFDIIARDESRSARPRDAVVTEGATLDLLFVPECNPSPLHHSYARAAIDLFEDPQLAPSPPVVVFGNIATGSSLPALGTGAKFGFSRIIGRLGDVDASGNIAIIHNGVVAAEDCAALSDVQFPPHRMPLPPIRSLVARPHESLIVAQLPRIGTGPTRDPTVGRANTRIEGFRWVGHWQRIRAFVEHAPRREQLGVPAGLLVTGGLIGTEQLAEELRTALAESASPVWVAGQGGVGKTALVAAVLHEIELPCTASILWIDLAEVDPEPDAVREHLLLKLGLSAALREAPEAQWNLLRTELAKRAIVVVLDSHELWGGASLPPELKMLSRWPSRVVITARNGPIQHPDTFTVLDVTPLDPANARALIRRGAPAEVEETVIAQLAEFAEGSPLACTWIGGALRSRDGDLLGTVGSATQSSDSALQIVFAKVTAKLSNTEKDVLLVLACVPSPLTVDDLADICRFSRDRVQSAILQLQDRHLALATTGAGVHTAHPFVRQFVVVWPRRPTAQQNLYSWAARRLEELGGDLKWTRYPKLNDIWPNIESVIQLLRASNPRDFLRLWRMSDYFLWSSGRRRERERLGRAAVELARQSDNKECLVHALFDSVAESRWHGPGGEDECIALLAEAQDVASSMSNPDPHVAMIECYRSRMLRHFNRLDASMSAAQRAVRLARITNDKRVLGLCENALGNAFWSHREYDVALTHFDEAAKCFAVLDDAEMIAIVLRNQGRCHAMMGERGRAIEMFEESVAGLRELHLHVECAEVALDHADALADLGEHDEAIDEASDARELFVRLGALHLVSRADTLLRRIRNS